MDGLSQKEKQILASHREILWLERQIEEYEQETQVDFELPETVTQENLQENLAQYNYHISDLRSELDKTAHLVQLKEKLKVNMDAQYFSTKALYPQNNNKKEEEEEKMICRDEKVVEFLKLLKSYTTIKNNLTRTQAELIRQHIKNKEINKEILELKENDISQVQEDYQALSQG
ncbi:hypothetical protein G6F56_012444 [Rhizopus delemar]|nr:hypothetical protein G6F56_012444 [Rhizopus delemar]